MSPFWTSNIQAVLHNQFLHVMRKATIADESFELGRMEASLFHGALRVHLAREFVGGIVTVDEDGA